MNFSEAVDRIFHGISNIPPSDPSLSYPVFSYVDDGACQYHLHNDKAKVPDIIVISDYTVGSDGWIHDRDFLTEFMEVSEGVPIGRYEVVEED